MKQIYFIFLACSFQLNAQIITIPDAKFKSKLLAASEFNEIAKNAAGTYFKIDSNEDGEIDVEEAHAVKYLDVNSANTGTVNQIQSIEGITNFINVDTLIIRSNMIAGTLDVTSLSNLSYLHCHGNKITELVIENMLSLKDLFCGNNLFTELDISSLSNLKQFNCSEHPGVSINVAGLANLEILRLSNVDISEIDLDGLSGLKILGVDGTLVTELDVSNLANLKELSVSSSVLTSLDVSNLANLEQLDCHFSSLLEEIILTGADNLTLLNVSYCHLTSLDVSSLDSIDSLIADNNPYLTSVNVEGADTLLLLNLSATGISELDASSLSHLDILRLQDCDLHSLYIKNGSIESVVQLAGIANLSYICADEAQFSSLAIPENTELNSYCTMGLAGDYNTIQGIVTYDQDANGCNEQDPTFPNFKFSIEGEGALGYLIPNSSGVYDLPVYNGEYVLSPILENPGFFNVTPSSLTVSFPGNSTPYTQNFCVTPDGVHHDVEVYVMYSQAIPGFDADYIVTYKNKGNMLESGTITLDYDDAVLDYVESNPSATQEGGTVQWGFEDLEPFETRTIHLKLNLNSPTENPPLNSGDVLSITALASTVDTDEVPENNTFVVNQLVVNSFDPNDKTCLEGPVVSPDMIGKYVHYKIRFENTGTFPAQNIVVVDRIDTAKFDIATLVPLNGSHPFETRISTGNKVEFIFEDINLPFENETNDGYVAFKIKTLPTLEVGDSFENEASIYFDYNFPIVTDPAITVIQELNAADFEFSKHFLLYPNPANQTINIETKDQIEIKSVSFYNALGQAVLDIKGHSFSTIDISSLSAGSYFIKVITPHGSSNEKFIKL